MELKQAFKAYSTYSKPILEYKNGKNFADVGKKFI